jgi:hypothetical protein
MSERPLGPRDRATEFLDVVEPVRCSKAARTVPDVSQALANGGQASVEAADDVGTLERRAAAATRPPEARRGVRTPSMSARRRTFVPPF